MIAKLQYFWYKLVHHITQIIALLLGVRVFGQGYIPESGGALIVSNHQSYLDPALLTIGSNRAIHFLARKELFESRFFLLGWIFKVLIGSLNALPLERRRFDSQGIRKAIERLKSGNLLIVFPEGTRTFNGEIGTLKSGVISLAQRAQVPIIPALIDGAFEVWSRHNRFPRRWYPIRVRYGSPIIIESAFSSDQLSQLVKQRIKALKPREKE